MKLISVIYSRDVLRQIKDESARQEEQRSALLSRIYTLTLILVITVFTYRNTWIWMWIRDITLRLQIAFIPECCIVFPVLFNYLNSCCQMFCNKSVAYTLSNRYHWWVPTYVYCNSLKCIEPNLAHIHAFKPLYHTMFWGLFAVIGLSAFVVSFSHCSGGDDELIIGRQNSHQVYSREISDLYTRVVHYRPKKHQKWTALTVKE